MAHKLINPREDTRIERALADPEAYFREAKVRARREVLAEMKQEAARRRRPRPFSNRKPLLRLISRWPSLI